MSLTKAQQALVQRARAVGTSPEAVPLDDAAASYLLVRIAHDLEHRVMFAWANIDIPDLYGDVPTSDLRIEGIDFDVAAEQIFAVVRDADTYFACLAALMKARLKFEKIQRVQPISTIQQVGPRGLLQYGSLPSRSLATLLLWRKWLYDIDNRAAQETGYVFEAVLAAAIGGTPISAKRSPVRRANDPSKGRQVDCIKGKQAYEFKIRVTIAASGQGRWNEELTFATDCVQSGFKPILVVLDDTENDKLLGLVAAFSDAGGDSYIGEAAWKMLEQEAGPAMSIFLRRYVRMPLDALLASVEPILPTLTLRSAADSISIEIDGEQHVISREMI